MGIRNTIGKWLLKDKRKLNGYPFDDDDRVLSQKIRRSKGEKKLLEQELERLEAEADLNDLREEISQYDEQPEKNSNIMSPDTLIMSLLMKLFTGTHNNNTSDSSIAAKLNTVEAPVMNTEQMQELINTVPKKYLKLAKNMNDDTLKALIQTKLPNINSTSLNSIVEMVKKKHI